MGDFSGFNIYRRKAGERFQVLPLNPQPIREMRYWDGALENGKRYEYEVRAVRNFRGSLIEGPSCAMVGGIPEKRTPPSPPTGLVAARQKDGIALRWDRNPEPDIAGYEVYRREKKEESFRKLNTQLIEEPYFLDASAELQKSYFYRLKALDTSTARRESDFSRVVEVSPQPSSPKY